ncbi:uncharacterized protein [Henckelia pumila]|uniref:uncharacterized protein n=1 Tax=Henckelia pumila TaxID=405737 RepID=UPI003C6E0E1D
MLVIPSGQGDFVAYTDAYKLGLGAVLIQQNRIIAYSSRHFKEHEKNYPTYDLELAAVKELNMRKWRWLELVKDYDCNISCHPGKANVIANALNMKATDEQLSKWMQKDEKKRSGLYSVVDGIFKFRGMKRDIARFVAELSDMPAALGMELLFSTPFHPQTDGQSKRVTHILEDVLRACAIDFQGSWELRIPLVESPVLWTKPAERSELGPKIVLQIADAVAKIRDRMRTALSRKKSYADQRRRYLKFLVCDHVFSRVAPMKGMMRFGKKGKLAPRFIGPFKIMDRVGTLAYRVPLLPSLDGVHNAFHVSMLKKYISNPSHVLSSEPLQLSPHMTYKERPDRILKRQERRLRNKTIQMVKVRWFLHSDEEATWKTEADRGLVIQSSSLVLAPQSVQTLELAASGAGSQLDFLQYGFMMMAEVGMNALKMLASLVVSLIEMIQPPVYFRNLAVGIL